MSARLPIVPKEALALRTPIDRISNLGILVFQILVIVIY